ncbi:MAG: tetratricopeptide repeat protein [Gemmatimonadota bacterium]
MKVEELKETARRHELREEWQKAFDLYRSAVRMQEVDEAPDITLFNRLGDIQTRLGQINGAVEHYEKAIDLYLEAELPNNAIAICKKVLRNLPDRNIFFLRMGKIRAEQGFLTDARQSFLTYAERQTARGDIESALNALVELVDLSPEDVEIRHSLASQLESHGRTEEAIEQYTEVYRRSILMDEGEEAKRVSEKLKELAPDLVLPNVESILAEVSVPDTRDLVFESTSLGGFELDDWGRDESGGFGGVEVELGDSEVGDKEEEDHEVESETRIDSRELEFGGLGTVESGSPPSETEEGGIEDGLPTFDFESEDSAEEVQVLPGFGGTDDAEEEPLPLLGFQDLDEAESLGEAALEDAVFEALREDPEESEAADTEPMEPGVVVPPGDHKEAADRGEMGLAIDRVKAQIESDPDSVELHQRMVEYAFRKNDPEILISAYLELAGCLARTGAPMKADAVYQQVLTLSPGHEGAAAGIQKLDGAPGARPPTQVASSEEYVDLGSMILGDEAERTTRWRVAAEAPSGDDEADFAKMLGQFKEKVSQNVAADDVAAHHDLGTAYMEMGLFEEAVAEFQMALRASPSHLPTHEVMGRCWMEMGKSDMAVRALNRALKVPNEVEDELIGIYYLMGRAQEDQGNNGQALEFYEKVFSLDINFEDVTERLRALR